MDLLRRFHSLGAKLVLLFFVLGAPVLVVVETVNLMREQYHLERDVEEGALLRVAEDRARRLAPYFQELARDPRAARDALQVMGFGLVQRDSGLSSEARYFLMEVAGEPIALALYDTAGRRLGASEGRGSDAFVARVEPGADALATAARGEAVQSPDERDGRWSRTATVPVRDASGVTLGVLSIALELPPVWRTILAKSGAEWPVMLACLLVLAAATTLFFGRTVARRIESITAAAGRWSSGDLRERVDARSGDELGRLGAALNAMAAQLEDHVATRARVATLEERQRLARDLHDTVKQKVFALNLQIAAAAAIIDRDRGEAARRLHEAQSLIGAINDELSTILIELRDGDAAQLLGPVLRALAEGWARRSGIPAEWERCDDALSPRWIGEQVTKLAEEALANVWRHSGATRARLALVAVDEQFSLQVADDGCGIVDGPPGMGLDNMRVRASALPSGSLDIESDAASGTRIVVCWRSGDAVA